MRIRSPHRVRITGKKDIHRVRITGKKDIHRVDTEEIPDPPSEKDEVFLASGA